MSSSKQKNISIVSSYIRISIVLVLASPLLFWAIVDMLDLVWEDRILNGFDPFFAIPCIILFASIAFARPRLRSLNLLLCGIYSCLGGVFFASVAGFCAEKACRVIYGMISPSILGIVLLCCIVILFFGFQKKIGRVMYAIISIFLWLPLVVLVTDAILN